MKALENEVGNLNEEIKRLLLQDTNKDAAHVAAIKQVEEQASRSRKEVAKISIELTQSQREKLSYQKQSTELKTALNSALNQLKVGTISFHLLNVTEIINF